MPHIHDKETGLCVVCKRLEIAAIKEGKKFKRQNYDVRKLAMEKTISRKDPNYRAIMDRHYVSLEKPDNKNSITPRATFMQKVSLDDKIEVPRREKVLTTTPRRSQSNQREQNNESVVDTRAKNDKSRATLRRANLADIARNQMSRSSNHLDYNPKPTNNTPPLYDYPLVTEQNTRPVFFDKTTIRKPVNLSKIEPIKNKPTAKIYELEDDDAEFDELKFTEESDSNFRDRSNYYESRLSQYYDNENGNYQQKYYDFKEETHLRGNMGDDRNYYDDDSELIYIPTKKLNDLHIKLKPKTVIIHHHYDSDRFEEDYVDNTKSSKVIYIEDEAFYKPGSTPMIAYRN